MLVSRDEYIEAKEESIEEYRRLYNVHGIHTAGCLGDIEERDLEEFKEATENDSADTLYEL